MMDLSIESHSYLIVYQQILCRVNYKNPFLHSLSGNCYVPAICNCVFTYSDDAWKVADANMMEKCYLCDGDHA